jgi:four helix bundle protein
LRSGTSVAAHVREASRARSDAEFCAKREGALQEMDEAPLWIELLRDECGIGAQALQELHDEADELIAIVVTMVNRTKTKAQNES